MSDKVFEEVKTEVAALAARLEAHPAMTGGEWAVILGAEFGGMCNAVCVGDPFVYRRQLVRVAAVAIQSLRIVDAAGETQKPSE